MKTDHNIMKYSKRQILFMAIVVPLAAATFLSVFMWATSGIF